MTNEEALKIAYSKRKDSAGEERDFLNTIIQALEQEPCDDAISRQYLVDKAVSWDKHFANGIRYVALTDILNAPPVTPQPKMGRWIDTGSGQECSECGEIQYGYDNFRHFCANCGRKMELEE